MTKAWVELKEGRETLCVNLDDLLMEMPKDNLYRFATRVAFADSIILALARTIANYPHGDIPPEQVVSLDTGDDMDQFWFGTDTVNKARQIIAPLAGQAVAAEIERLRMTAEKAEAEVCRLRTDMGRLLVEFRLAVAVAAMSVKQEKIREWDELLEAMGQQEMAMGQQEMQR